MKQRIEKLRRRLEALTPENREAEFNRLADGPYDPQLTFTENLRAPSRRGGNPIHAGQAGKGTPMSNTATLAEQLAEKEAARAAAAQQKRAKSVAEYQQIIGARLPSRAMPTSSIS